MSKAVLISIRPEWCKKIANGEKTVEIRKTCPGHRTPFKAYIYCTNARPRLAFADVFRGNWCTEVTEIGGYSKDDAKRTFDIFNGCVIGEFICDDIYRIGPEECVVKEDIESAIAGSCLTVQQVKDYAGWKSGMRYADLKDLYGWRISNLKIYDHPQPLHNFTRLRETKFGYEPVKIERAPQSWFYVEEMRHDLLMDP